MCAETCECKKESNYAGCGCSSSFDNADGRGIAKLKELAGKGSGLVEKGKQFLAGMKGGAPTETPPYTPPEKGGSKTPLYLGIGAVIIIIVVVVIVVVIKNRS